MRLLLNENIGRTAAQSLRKQGHDVVWIGDGHVGADDRAVLAKARRESRVLVTKDKDFGELAFRRGLAYHGVILLRLMDERPANTIRVLEGVILGLFGRKSPFFVVASESGFRVHA